MSDDNKKQLGDGNDNYGQAIKNAGEAAKQLSVATKEIAKTTANAAAASVSAGVKTGKAVANIAKGMALGGPWGAIISAAWSMRNTIFKIIVVICLVLLILIVAALSMPLFILDKLFGTSQNEYSDYGEAYNDAASQINQVIDDGYNLAYFTAEQIILNGGYDLGLSLIAKKDYDKNEKIHYILSAYSVSVNYDEQNFSDLLLKLKAVKDEMFSISVIEKTESMLIDSASLEYENVAYLECELSFNDTAVLNGFSVDPNEKYMDSDITKGEMMDEMINSLTIAEQNGI